MSGEECGDLARALAVHVPCIGMLIELDDRRVLEVNTFTRAQGIFPGSKCYESWFGLPEPCDWCLAAEACKDGDRKEAVVEYQGAIYKVSWVALDEHRYIHYAFNITDEDREKQALVSIVEERERFLQDLTHEMRTPLISVLGGIDLLLEEFGTQLGAEGTRLARLIQKGAVSLDKIIKKQLAPFLPGDDAPVAR